MVMVRRGVLAVRKQGHCKVIGHDVLNAKALVGLIVCAKQRGLLKANGQNASSVKVLDGSLQTEGLETTVMHAMPKVEYKASTYSLANHAEDVGVRHAIGRVQKNANAGLPVKGSKRKIG